MDGHQFRGARIHRDMMLVSSVCRRALGCEWEGLVEGQAEGFGKGSLLRNEPQYPTKGYAPHDFLVSNTRAASR